MAVRVHPGLPRTGKSGQAGSPRSERDDFRGSKSKAPPSLPVVTAFASPCRIVTLRQTLVRRCHGGRIWLQSGWRKGGLACAAIMRLKRADVTLAALLMAGQDS